MAPSGSSRESPPSTRPRAPALATDAARCVENSTITTEETAVEAGEQTPFEAKWRLLARAGVRCYILLSMYWCGAAPLQILQFTVVLPHKFQDAEKFNLQFLALLRNYRKQQTNCAGYDDTSNWPAAERRSGLCCIDRSTYVHYEEYGKDLYPLEHMERNRAAFEVPVETLLDDYNLFLWKGQGEQIKTIRRKTRLTSERHAEQAERQPRQLETVGSRIGSRFSNPRGRIFQRHNHSRKRADRRSMPGLLVCYVLLLRFQVTAALHQLSFCSVDRQLLDSFSTCSTGTLPAPAQAPAAPALISGRSEILPWLPSFPERFLLQSMRVFRRAM